MHRSLRVLSLAAVLVGTGAGTTACANEPLDVASSVDLQHFQGKWYEIARLPRSTQKDCFGTTAFYSAPSAGGMQFVNQCNVGSMGGPLDTVTMSATVPDPSTPAKLALDIGGYSGDYWILDVGPSYEYAVVGHPSRLYLWILSRTPTLDPATTETLVAHAKDQHFDTSQLIFTPQSTEGERVSAPGPVGPVPPALATGCAVSVPGRPAPRGRLALAILGLAFVGRYAARRARKSPSPA